MPSASEVDELVLQTGGTLDHQRHLRGSVGFNVRVRANIKHPDIHMHPCSPLGRRSWVQRIPKTKVSSRTMNQ